MIEKPNEFFPCPYKTCPIYLRERPSSLPHHNPYKSRMKVTDENIYLAIDDMETDIELLRRRVRFMDSVATVLIGLLLALALLIAASQSLPM